MSISTESYTAVAAQARQATEQGVKVFKNSAKTFADQINVIGALPTIDLTEPVARYFEYVQKSIDLSRGLLTTWAELITSLTGAMREQAEKTTDFVKEQTDVVSDLGVKQAETAEDLAQRQAAEIEEAEIEQEKAAKAAERAAAKKAKEQASEPYEGLTKAELADQLAGRDLPKSGTVEELIGRLVAADNE
jgi:hypothetical protein